MTLSNLRQFSYKDKFRMSFDNVLIFTGHFINSSDKDLLGKNLYIPVTPSHPAFTLNLTHQTWSGSEEISSLIVKFNSDEERKAVASCDFTDDIFFVDA